MALEGTVLNGVVVFDGNPQLPEGTRVRVELEEVFEYPHPLAPYDREREGALLRERIATMQAGEKGIPVDEAMARIAAELNLPAVDPE